MICVKIRLLFSRSRSQWRFKSLCISNLLYHWTFGNQTGCSDLLFLIAKPSTTKCAFTASNTFSITKCSTWVYFATEGDKPCFVWLHPVSCTVNGDFGDGFSGLRFAAGLWGVCEWPLCPDHHSGECWARHTASPEGEQESPCNCHVHHWWHWQHWWVHCCCLLTSLLVTHCCRLSTLQCWWVALLNSIVTLYYSLCV